MRNTVVDLIGVGFGPSNLAVAALLKGSGSALSALFLEREPRFMWHQDMLLDGADMQISFLKDLATLRNPHN